MNVTGKTQHHLGKIRSVKFGLGGYQDVMFGLTLSFSFDRNAEISDFMGSWDPENIECTPGAKWTEADRDAKLVETCRFISKIMAEAKVDDVMDLVGKPVSITIENSSPKDWRILTEVL